MNASCDLIDFFLSYFIDFVCTEIILQNRVDFKFSSFDSAFSHPTSFYLFLTANMDPYAILTCRTQEKKSSVASGCIFCSESFNSSVFMVSINQKVLLLRHIEK